MTLYAFQAKFGTNSEAEYETVKVETPLDTRMRTSPVVHVSNLKCYYPTRHKEVVRPHVTKKNFTAKKVKETLIEKTRRIDDSRIDFQ